MTAKLRVEHIIAFSGGLASAVVAKIVSEQHPVTLLFHDTKTEPVDNNKFRSEVSNYLSIPISEVSDGRTLLEAKDHCIRVANKYEKKEAAADLQDPLFELPCDCVA